MICTSPMCSVHWDPCPEDAAIFRDLILQYLNSFILWLKELLAKENRNVGS